MAIDLFQKIEEDQQTKGKDLFSDLNSYKTKYDDNAFGLDYMSTPQTEENNNDFFTVMSEEEKLELVRKGPIGVGEAYERQNKLELLPFSPAGLINSGSVLLAVKRLQKNEYDGDTGQRQKDIEKFEEFAYKMEEENIRGFSWKGKVYNVASMMPSFMIEFAVSGGLASVVKKGAKKVAGGVAKQVVKKTAKELAEEVAKRSIPKTIAKGMVKATQVGMERAPFMYNRYGQKYAENQIFSNIALTDKGTKILDQSEESQLNSFVRAYGDTLIEVASESMGEQIFGPVMKKAGGGMVKNLSPAFVKKINKFVNALQVNPKIGELLKTVGFNGIPEEIMEEFVGDQFRAVFGVEDFGMEDGNIIDRMRGAWGSDMDNLSVMAGAFAIPMVTSFAGGRLYDKLIKRGYTGEDARNVMEHTSESEKENLYKTIQAEDKAITQEAIRKAVGGQELSEAEMGALMDAHEEFIDRGYIAEQEGEVAPEQMAQQVQSVEAQLGGEAVGLVEEAQNYATAEEFVASQESQENENIISAEELIEYAETQGETDFDTYFDEFDKDANYELKTLKISDVLKGDQNIAEEIEGELEEPYNEKNVDAPIIMTKDGAVVDGTHRLKAKSEANADTITAYVELPSKIKTKQQLTDIWNKAQNIPLTPLGKIIKKARDVARKFNVNIRSIDVIDEVREIDYNTKEGEAFLLAQGITKEEIEDAKAKGERYRIFGQHQYKVGKDGQRWSEIKLFRGYNNEDLAHELAHAFREQGHFSNWVGAEEVIVGYIARELESGREMEDIMKDDPVFPPPIPYVPMYDPNQMTFSFGAELNPVDFGTYFSTRKAELSANMKAELEKLSELIPQVKNAGNIPIKATSSTDNITSIVDKIDQFIMNNPDKFIIRSDKALVSNRDYGCNFEPENICARGYSFTKVLWEMREDLINTAFTKKELKEYYALKKIKAKDRTEQQAKKYKEMGSLLAGLRTASGRKLLELGASHGLLVPCIQCYVAEKRISGYSAKSSKEGIAQYQRGDLNDKAMTVIDDFGGVVRMYSFGDFAPSHIPSVVRLLEDAMERGVSIGTYTKNLNFVEIFGDTGITFNISVGRSSAIGLPIEIAHIYALRYPNAGLCYMAVNEEDLIKAGLDPRVHKIIPAHIGNGVPKALLQSISGDQWENFQSQQEEKIILNGTSLKLYGNSTTTNANELGISDKLNKARELIKKSTYTNSTEEYLKAIDKASKILGQKITPKFAKYTKSNNGKAEDWYHKLIGSGSAEYGKDVVAKEIDLSKMNTKKAEEYFRNFPNINDQQVAEYRKIADKIKTVAKKGADTVNEMPIADRPIVTQYSMRKSGDEFLQGEELLKKIYTKAQGSNMTQEFASRGFFGKLGDDITTSWELGASASHEEMGVYLGVDGVSGLLKAGLVRFNLEEDEMRFETDYPLEHAGTIVRKIKDSIEEHEENYMDGTVLVDSKGKFIQIPVADVVDNPRKAEARISSLGRGVQYSMRKIGAKKKSVVERYQRYQKMEDRIEEIKTSEATIGEKITGLRGLLKDTTAELNDYKKNIALSPTGKYTEEFDSLDKYYKNTKQGKMELDEASKKAGFGSDIKQFIDHMNAMREFLNMIKVEIEIATNELNYTARQQVVKSEKAYLKQRVTDYKQGKLEGKKTLADLKQEITTRARKILPEGKSRLGKVLTAINSVENEKTLAEAVDTINEVYNDYIEAVGRAKIIKKLLKKYKRPENIMDSRYREKIEEILGQYGRTKTERRKGLAQLSSEELAKTGREVMQLVEEGKKTLAEKKKLRMVAEELIRGGLIKSAGGMIDVDAIGSMEERTLAKEKGWRRWQSRAKLEFMRPLRLIRMLFDKFGESMIYDSADQSEIRAKARKTERLMEIDKVLKKYKIDLMKLGESVTIDGVTYQINNIMTFYAQRNNEEGRQALIYGNRISEETYEKFINYLLKNENDVAQATMEIREIVGARYDTIRQTMQEVFNITLNKVKEYFPMSRMRMESQTDPDPLMGMSFIGDAVLKGFNVNYSAVEKGMSISRQQIAERNQMPISVDFIGDSARAIDTQEHLIAFAPIQKLYNSLKGDTALREAITYRHGQYAWDTFDRYLNETINPRYYHQGIGVLGQWAKAIRKAMGVYYLGFNPVTAMKQVPSLHLVLKYTSMAQLYSSMAQISLNPELRAKMVEYDPSLEQRIVEREIEEIMAGTSKLYRADFLRQAQLYQNQLGKASMQWVMNMDKWAVAIAFHSVYTSNLDKLGHAGAVNLAHKSILESQPQGRRLDLPQAYRTQNEFVKMALMFTNQLNQIWNMVAFDMPSEWKQGNKKQAVVGLTSIMLSSFMIYMLTHGGEWPDDEEKQAGAFFDAIFGSIASSVPVVGNYVMSGVRGYGSSLNPVDSIVESFSYSSSRIKKGEMSGLVDMLANILILGGVQLPYNSARKGYQGLLAILDGEEDIRRMIWSKSALFK